jgi:quercetin dioxygenase-like cupin family protein
LAQPAAKEASMPPRLTLVVVTLIVAITAGISASQVLLAQQAPIKRTTLQQKDLDGVAGKEVVMYVAEIAPGGVAGRHFHPGPEFVYVLEGALTIAPDGQAPMTFKKGDSFHNPAKAVHDAKNASTSEAAKALVVLIGEKGAPLSTVAK